MVCKGRDSEMGRENMGGGKEGKLSGRAVDGVCLLFGSELYQQLQTGTRQP